jgi:cytochrome c
MKTIAKLAVVAGACAGLVAVGTAAAYSAAARHAELIAPGLAMPAMDPVRGKELFASKGCVVCHSIHGVGGTDAPKLDASTMKPIMNPFEFFAKMWRGATPMIMMQMHELGHQIAFTGQDLADIVAFAHNRGVQKTFTAADIPPAIKKMMEGGEEHEKGGGGAMGRGMMGGPRNRMGRPAK